MNHWDIIIIIALAIAVTLAVIKIIKNKKYGKSNCGCDCSRCAGCRGCSGAEAPEQLQNDR